MERLQRDQPAEEKSCLQPQLLAKPAGFGREEVQRDQVFCPDEGAGNRAPEWVNRPDGSQKVIKPKSKVLYDTIPSDFLDLNAGRIKGILLDENYAEYYIKHEADSKSYQVILNKEVPEDLFAVGMRKGDKNLKKKINQALAELQANGTLAKINQKWFGQKSNYLGKVD